MYYYYYYYYYYLIIIIIIIETVGLRVPNGNFSLFNVDFKRRNCPARCAAAANAINSGTDIFNGHSV